MPTERILLVRLSSLGDIVLATPVAQELRRRYPKGEITWLVDWQYREVLAGLPEIDRVLAYDYLGRHRGLSGILRLAEEIGGVDLVVDLQHKARSLLLSTALRPKHRLVLVKRTAGQLARALLGRDVIQGAPHQVERYLALLGPESSGQPNEPRLAADPRAREEARRTYGWKSPPPIGVLVGARHPTKCWPTAHLIEFCIGLWRRGQRVILLGGPEQHRQAVALAAALPECQPQLYLENSLAGLAAMLSICRLVVGPDSGPMHLAAALGVPTVSLFGPTSPERWAPRGSPGRVVRLELECSPCSNHGSSHCSRGHHACMARLEPKLVWQAVDSLLQTTGR